MTAGGQLPETFRGSIHRGASFTTPSKRHSPQSGDCDSRVSDRLLGARWDFNGGWQEGAGAGFSKVVNELAWNLQTASIER
jgi:hypothetical protein